MIRAVTAAEAWADNITTLHEHLEWVTYTLACGGTWRHTPHGIHPGIVRHVHPSLTGRYPTTDYEFRFTARHLDQLWEPAQHLITRYGTAAVWRQLVADAGSSGVLPSGMLTAAHGMHPAWAHRQPLLPRPRSDAQLLTLLAGSRDTMTTGPYWVTTLPVVPSPRSVRLTRL